MNKIESYQWQSFPVNEKTKNNLNLPNKDVEIDIKVGDGWIDNNAHLYITFDVSHSDGTDYTNYEGKSNVKLIDNFPTQFWTTVTVKKRGYTICRIDHPNISSTVLLNSTASFNDKMMYTGNFINNTALQKKENELRYPLRLLGGFFKDYKEIMWEGDLTITFTWSQNANDALYRWWTKDADGHNMVGTLPKEGKVTVKSMEIKIPVLKYEPNYELELREKILKEPKIPISFFDLQTQEISGLSGKRNFEIDITNYYNSMEFDMPYFIFVVFQTNRKGNQENDSSKFDHVQLQNIYLKNGRNEMFPEEMWNINPPNTYLNAYDAFRDFKRVTELKSDVYISPAEFITSYPIYVVNISRRRNVVTPQKTSMKLTATFNGNIPENTLAYIIMYGKKNLTYDAKHGIVTENF